MNILVVAEAAPLIFTLEQLLVKHGHVVLSAKGLSDALEVLAENSHVDLVLSDLLLRHTTGVELYHSAVQQAALGDGRGSVSPPRFMFMSAPQNASGESETQLREQAMTLSEGNLLLKPIDKADLLARIQHLSKRTGPAVEIRTPANRGAASQAAAPSAAAELMQRVLQTQRQVADRLDQLGESQRKLDSHVNQLEQRISLLESSAKDA
jgi:CheY-like chemotaxis protein